MICVLICAPVLGAAPTADARQGCQSKRCDERVHRKKCSNRAPRHCVERAVLTYRLIGWQAAWMRRIPSCESGWNPLAYYPGKVAETAAEQRWVTANDVSAGLYAFKPSTWRGTPYGGRSQFRAKWNALGAAWMVRQGRTREWVCT